MIAFTQILEHAQEIKVYNNGNVYEIPEIKTKLKELLENSYSSPSLAQGKNAPLEKITNVGVWIHLSLNNQVDYMGEMCNKILFALKPKYDFLMVYKMLDDEICNKVPMVNLATKTNKILDYIQSFCK